VASAASSLACCIGTSSAPSRWDANPSVAPAFTDRTPDRSHPGQIVPPGPNSLLLERGHYILALCKTIFSLTGLRCLTSCQLSDQCAADKKTLYGTLALKQIQRAAQTAPAATGGDSDRSIRTEEEILLYFRILETHGSVDEWQAALNDAHLGPVNQFRLGRKDLLLRALEVCTKRGEWQTVYKQCKDCLVGSEDTRQINLLACDWSIWEHFLKASSHLRATQPG